MGWKANAKVSAVDDLDTVNNVQTVRLEANAEDVTFDGDDDVQHVSIQIISSGATHLKVGDVVAVEGNC